VDSELWPEHLHHARKTGIPAGIINGRLSARSFFRYCRIPAIARWLWGHISFVFACGDEAARRIEKFISHPSRIIATGNLKCSRQPSLPLKKSERASLLHSLGLPDVGRDKKLTRILFGCSTWPGEEELLLQTFMKLRETDPNWRLILVPRHAERREEIASLCKCGNFSFHFRSAGEPRAFWHDVAIVDTTGELSEFIRLGTIAFLGKTLPPNAGAQSPLDAAAAKVPLVSGPNYDNFREIMEALRVAGAIKICPDADAVKSILLQLAYDEKAQREMSAGMLHYFLATKNMARTICEYIENRR
jgi:3-deoxy-D-manno-octulosonic-acid transferase